MFLFPFKISTGQSKSVGRQVPSTFLLSQGVSYILFILPTDWSNLFFSYLLENMPTAISHLATLTRYGLTGANQHRREHFVLFFYPEEHATVWVEKRKAKQLSAVSSSQGLPMGTLMSSENLQKGWKLTANWVGYTAAQPRALSHLSCCCDNKTNLKAQIWPFLFFISEDSKLTFTDQIEVPPPKEEATTNQHQTVTQTRFVHSCSPPSRYSISMLQMHHRKSLSYWVGMSAHGSKINLVVCLMYPEYICMQS